jgi:MFS family permease
VVNASTSLPILFFSVFAGVIADRHDKRRILLIAQGVAGGQALALGLLTHFGLISLSPLIVLAMMLGMANAFEVPTRQSFFAELVGPRDLSNAIALNSVAFNGTRMIAPAIAGPLIEVAGVAACFYGNAVSYIASFFGLLAIRREPPVIEPRTESTWSDIREGFAWILGDGVARIVVLFIASASILIFPYSMLLPVFARDLLQIGPRGLGWLYSATGAGALLGGLVMATAANRFPRGRLLLLAGTGFTGFVGLFAIATPVWLALVFLCAAGFCMILSTASANSLLQSRVPDALRGRVMAVYVVMFLGMGPVGSVLAGTAARLFDARIALGSGALVMLTLIATVMRRSGALRKAV